MSEHTPTLVTLTLPIDHRTSYVDGHKASAAEWARLDFAKPWTDPGPSPAGNEGPYLKAPHPQDGTVHRIYCRYYREQIIRARGLNLMVVDFAADLDALEWHVLCEVI